MRGRGSKIRDGDDAALKEFERQIRERRRKKRWMVEEEGERMR